MLRWGSGRKISATGRGSVTGMGGAGEAIKKKTG